MTTRRQEMIRSLGADGPHPSLGEQGRVFDRFVGTWNADYTHFTPEGAVLERYPGQVLFGWILNGWAVEDIWSWGPREGQAEASAGISIRYFDAGAGIWHVIWILPENGTVVTVQGGIVGDRIVLEGANPNGTLRRWSFNEIGPDSFVWRGERSEDGGSTWRLNAEYQMSRAT